MIYIDASTLAELTSYAGLLKSITRWLERDDLAEQAPSFVRLAEARFNRVIRSQMRDTTVTLPAGVGTVPLPADFDGARHLFGLGTPNRNIAQVTPHEFHSCARPKYAPTVFAIEAGQMLLDPVPDVTVTARLTYTARVPYLSAEIGTNWLLDQHPDLYLFASVLHAEFYGWNDARLPLIKSAVDEMIDEINRQANRQRYGASPLVMRTPVPYDGVR